MTVRGNVSEQPGISVAATSREEQLELYDELPKRYRDLIDALPIPQDVRRIVEVRKQMGDLFGYHYLVERFRVAFPGWTPP